MMSVRPFAIVALAALVGGLLTPTADAQLVVGGFDVSRGGALSIAAGSVFTELRSSISAVSPGASFVGADSLTPAFLTGVDVLLISSPASGHSAITPLTGDEQSALLNFVKNGGTAILMVDNDTFAGGASDPANQSMLDPFNVDVVGTGAPWPQNVTISNPARSPITSGPFGTVPNFTVGWTGWFSSVPRLATVLGAVDEARLPGLLFIPRHQLAACSGGVIMISDATAFVDGYFSSSANNEILIQNIIAYAAAPTCVAGQCGDVNHDGSVDAADLAVLLGAWGTSNLSTDLDSDGTTSAADLGILLGNWGSC